MANLKLQFSTKVRSFCLQITKDAEILKVNDTPSEKYEIPTIILYSILNHIFHPAPKLTIAPFGDNTIGNTPFGD